jgi:hypothetical protein
MGAKLDSIVAAAALSASFWAASNMLEKKADEKPYNNIYSVVFVAGVVGAGYLINKYIPNDF